jgi:hypothetical protein
MKIARNMEQKSKEQEAQERRKTHEKRIHSVDVGGQGDQVKIQKEFDANWR